MPLFPCPACEHEVSPHAVICPQCGPEVCDEDVLRANPQVAQDLKTVLKKSGCSASLVFFFLLLPAWGVYLLWRSS